MEKCRTFTRLNQQCPNGFVLNANMICPNLSKSDFITGNVNVISILKQKQFALNFDKYTIVTKQANLHLKSLHFVDKKMSPSALESNKHLALFSDKVVT